MDPKHAFNEIELDTFNGLLTRYPGVVPSGLADLDQERLHTVPDTLHARVDRGLKKHELVTLMDWKLSHGKFRPSLKKLINENDEEQVLKTTSHAFELYEQEPDDIKNVMSQLCQLRGVGPATASLILSVQNETDIPFFSDELFRWAFWNKSGWEQKIKYTAKEYIELYTRVQEFRKRLDVPALSVEKVAYVLGKTAVEPTTVAKPTKRTASDVQVDDATNEPDKLSSRSRKLRKRNVK
ncbi:hypothetical protein LTR78_009636 [Recurvomyces mirabilis]|uniref:Uncharacterized protein n=1 Tax=Recurvomyces mirabilis TaxID=574656 RepID=A0AAE0TNJ9_9PEZI|nr:hypothetical protein LTR78_009636 [Recurvomyces mirabilis]KAK5152126.1 hypothetical protein LTS14_008501 [Recurvomyces mirabilis]